MSRPIWMPLYVGDYMRDTRRLSTVEHGAYLLLIMEYWTHGGLPNDDRQLAKIAGLSAEEWADMRDTIAGLFGPDWTHKRVDDEIAKAAARSDKARDKANKRWQSDGNAPDEAGDMPQHLPQHSSGICPDDASHSHSHREDNKLSSQKRAFAKEFAETFWPAYPNKVGKPAAEKAFHSARKRGNELPEIMAGLDRYKRTKPPDRSWLNPATFLNQDRWADEVAPAATVLPFATASPPPREEYTDAERERRLREWRERGFFEATK